MTRINRVLEHMAKLQVDSVIIKDVTTIRYLTGFTGDSSLLYLDRQQGVLITDGRYTEQARNEMKFFKVLEYTPTGAHSIWAAAADLKKLPLSRIDRMAVALVEIPPSVFHEKQETSRLG